MQVVLGPHGEGLQGSGFSMHLWFSQTKPLSQSGSLTHSGPQPVMVSGLGMKLAMQRQMALPLGLLVQEVLGPHGDGLQGSLGAGGGLLKEMKGL